MEGPPRNRVKGSQKQEILAFFFLVLVKMQCLKEPQSG